MPFSATHVPRRMSASRFTTSPTMLCLKTEPAWRSAIFGPFLMSMVHVAPSMPTGLTEGAAIARAELVAFANLAFLRRIAVAIHDALLWCRNTLDELQPGQRSLFLDQFLVWQAAQAEVLPPARLLFAAVPVEHVGEQPTPLLLFGPLAGVEWDLADQPVV